MLREGFKKEAFDVRQKNPLVLAFMGDTVFDLYVRTLLVSKDGGNVHALHKKSIAFVCAKAQSKACLTLLEEMDEDELYIYKRGRNAHPSTVPKNADLMEYRTATGLEAVLGFLYLCARWDRLDWMMEKILMIQKGGTHAPSQTQG